MHNWWIAALEHFGLITREEAEHIAGEIKLTIHKDRYAEAYKELEAILSKGKLSTNHVVTQLENELLDLKARVRELEGKNSTETPKPVAKAIKG